MIIRIFDTAMEPEDIERAKEIFRTTVRPAFEGFAGCHGIDMYIGIEEHSRDLVDVAAISKWDSMAAVEAAVASPGYEEALDPLRALFQQTPILRHFHELTE